MLAPGQGCINMGDLEHVEPFFKNGWITFELREVFVEHIVS